jgi:putative ABC transport system substrate-binding protein
MRRRDFIQVIAVATTWPLAARARQSAMPEIAFLGSSSADLYVSRLRVLREGLKEGGYVEGENVVIVYRFAENNIDRLPQLASDLVRDKVDVIVTTAPPAAFAAKAATSTIPTLFLVGDDPVRLGLVPSLSRPAGNITGIYIFNAELAAKRLELLRLLVPAITRIAVLVNPADAALTERQLKDVDAAATAMGLQIRVFNADTIDDVNLAFATMARERSDALFVGVTPFLNSRRIQITQLAAYHRLPATYASREFAEAGGLMSYGSDVVGAYRQLGIYSGRILKGVKPADLPVVQTNKFELIINAQTARMLGLIVPPSMLATADEVIE